MRKSFLVGSASLLAIATPGWAQTAPSPPATPPPAVPPPSAADAGTDGDIVVTGLRASLERALQVKRAAENHVEAISASDIGKLPDKNVADAVQRLPGINTSSAASGEGGFDEN